MQLELEEKKRLLWEELARKNPLESEFAVNIRNRIGLTGTRQHRFER